MTLGKLAWIVGGVVFFSVAAALFVFSLALFTDVFATTHEQVMYDCTSRRHPPGVFRPDPRGEPGSFMGPPAAMAFA